MGYYTSLKTLSAAQHRRADNMRRSALIAQEQSVASIEIRARELVSGNVSSKVLADLGHPFGRLNRPGRRPRVRVALLPINIQSGELLKSLRVFRRSVAGGIAFQLQFTSSHAIVTRPGGSARMIDRGFWPMLRLFAEPVLYRTHLAAKRRVEAT
jgi:hypothetical protein